MIIIDQEFSTLIPPLTKTELAGLEADLIECDGAITPLLAWGSILLDGHNRYNICNRLNLSFEVKNMNFPDRASAMAWMIRHQLHRRNINKAQRVKLALRLKPLIAGDNLTKILSGKQENKNALDPPLNSGEGRRDKETSAQVADAAGVSKDTVEKVEKVIKEGSEELQKKMLSGKVSINKAHKEVTADEPDPDETVYKDKIGNVIDKDDLIEIFGEADDMLEEARRDLVWMSKLTKYLDELGFQDFYNRQHWDRDIKNLKAAIKFMRPYAICPKCDIETSKHCRTCGGQGWVPQEIYKNIPKDE